MDDDERGETKKQRIVLFPSKIQDEVHDAFKKVMDAQLDSMMQATEKYVERKKKEIEEAAARIDEPLVFSPALTHTSPFYPEPQEERAARIIRPRTIEVVTLLDDDLYSVCYLIDAADDYVHVCTCWGNVLCGGNELQPVGSNQYRRYRIDRTEISGHYHRKQRNSFIDASNREESYGKIKKIEIEAQKTKKKRRSLKLPWHNNFIFTHTFLLLSH